MENFGSEVRASTSRLFRHSRCIPTPAYCPSRLSRTIVGAGVRGGCARRTDQGQSGCAGITAGQYRYINDVRTGKQVFNRFRAGGGDDDEVS